MAYSEQTGIANPQSLIEAIRIFAEANGWTTMRNDLVSTNRTLTLKHASSDYIHIFNTNTTQVFMIGSIDYNGATSPAVQTKRSLTATCDVAAGPYTKIYLFADTSPSRYVHIAVETAIAGTFKHLSFGMVDKLEAFTGGTYLDSIWWSAAGQSQAVDYSGNQNHMIFGSDISTAVGGIRCDFAADSRVDAWFGFSANTGSAATASASIRTAGGSAAANFPHGPIYLSKWCDNNNFSNRSIGHRIELYVFRTGGSYWSEIGSVPNMRIINFSKFTIGQEVVIGSDTWKIFPAVRSGVGVSPAYPQGSGVVGIAYKKT